MPKTEGLTEKEELFVQEYLIDLNAAGAARRAGYSEDTAASIGYQLLNKDRVREAIEKAGAERAKRVQVTADDVLREILLVARCDIAAFYDDKGRLLHPTQMPPEARRAISGIDVFEEFDGYGEDRSHVGDTKKLKLWDKMKALDLLARHLKLVNNSVEVTGKLTLADLVSGSLEEIGGSDGEGND